MSTNNNKYYFTYIYKLLNKLYGIKEYYQNHKAY